jgi:hypothetical protein
MGEFHQHPDGEIWIRNGNGNNYHDTPENFARDFGEAAPALPAGANEQIYTQGQRHCFMGGGNIIAGGNMPDPQLDAVIARVADGLAARANRAAVGVSILDMGRTTNQIVSSNT